MGLACGKTDFKHVAEETLFLPSSDNTLEPSPVNSHPDVFSEQFELCSVRDEGVVVLVRIRPKTDRERTQRTFMEVQGPTQLYVPASKSTPTEKTMSFDAVLPERTSQEQVYAVAGPKLIHNVLQGFNATMIAYGQTGSGKTFTMEGTAQDPGVTPRLCRGLFEAIRASSAGRSFTVLATFVEIYQENIRDLLLDAGVSPSSRGSRTSPKSISPPAAGGRGGGGGGSSMFAEDAVPLGGGKGKPTIRENKDGVYVENVTAQRVDNEEAVLALLAMGSNARTKGETQMNAESSRSHAVLMLAISQTPREENDEAEGDNVSNSSGTSAIGTIRSKISLVDLAGSERAKSTGASGQRLKEGANINKSLSALGNVIKALTAGGGEHVPYRDSKLTRLLQDSLGGTAYTVVCCNVSPIEASENETLSTLRFAERLRKVKNAMVVHMDARSRELLMLKRENAELRARVRYLEEITGVLRDPTTASTLRGGRENRDGASGNIEGGVWQGVNSRGGGSTPRSPRGAGSTPPGTTRGKRFVDADMCGIRTPSSTSSSARTVPRGVLVP